MLSVRLLGPGEVVHERTPYHFESRKSLAVFGYVAAQRQTVSRSLLADLFWCAKTEAAGRNNLSRVLHDLSTALPGCFQNDYQSVEFRASPACRVDLYQFEDWARQDTTESLASAAELYRGEFLAGVDLDDCPDFEVWLVAERERWRQRELRALHKAVEGFARHAQFERASNLVERALRIEPSNEESHRLKMTLLAQHGQRDAAVAHYETAKKVLGDELGVQLSAETEALYERIRKGDLAPSARVTEAPAPVNGSLHNFAPQLDSFVGRESLTEEVCAYLSGPDCRLLTLVGPAGAGKTRLAIEAAGRLTAVFPDGICFVPLAAINSPQFLVPAISYTVAPSFGGTGDLKTQLLDYMREKRMLLILDNMEHLLEGAPLIVEILQEAEHVRILATSQERLNIRPEWVLDVEGLPYPRDNEPGPLESFAAVRLFLDRARNAEPHFQLAEDSREPILCICQLVEGMPLGIELAAAWAGRFSCAYIAREIEHNLDFLSGSRRDVSPRHRSLRAALDWSLNLLSEPERALYRRLSVFAGSFSLEAARVVCDLQDRVLSESDKGQALGLLRALADKSLLRTRSVEDAQPRLAMLSPVREYARELAVANREWDVLCQRHAAYFLALAEQAAPHLTSAERAPWLARLDAEYNNLQAALVWSQEEPSRADIALRLTAALTWYWYFRNYLNRGARHWIERSLSNSAAADPSPARAQVLFGAGSGAWLQGDYDSSRALLGESLDVAQRLENRSMQAYALTLLGLAHMRQGDLQGARTLERQSTALFSALGDRWGLALALTNLELTLRGEVQDPAAPTAGVQALTHFRALGDRWGMALALNNLADAAFEKSRYALARTYIEEALAIRREVGDHWLLAQSQSYLGEIVLRLGDLQAAAHYLRESLMLNRELGNRNGLIECFRSIARLHAVQGDFQGAVCLEAAAESLRLSVGLELLAVEQEDYDRELLALKASTPQSVWETAWAEGASWTWSQAADFAASSPILTSF